MKKIKVKIFPNGEVEIETEGFKGKECVEATKDVERLLGKVVSDKKKPEYFSQAEKTTLRSRR